MPPAVYEQIFEEPVTYTNAFAIVPGLDDTVKSEIAEDLLQRDDIMALSYNDTIIDQFNNTISSMQAIVVVIVLTAGALAFVVLYNLTNINIEERVREIATIKVLGFNMKETIGYVFRENIILTLLGIAIGLGLGTIMTDFVVNIIELDLVMFGRGVSWISSVSYTHLDVYKRQASINIQLNFHYNKDTNSDIILITRYPFHKPKILQI